MINFRLKIYEELAKKARSCNIDWVVLHGVEGYPSAVGRDLDVICKTKHDEYSLIKCFNDILSNCDVKWVIVPHPIWGNRIVGINSNFDTVELHILRELRTFFVIFNINWEKIKYINNIFPVNEDAAYFKAKIMPSVNGKMLKREDVVSGCKPHWMGNNCFKKLKPFQGYFLLKRNFFISYFKNNPIGAMVGLLSWFVIKILSYFSATVPIFLIDSNNELSILSCINNNLSEVYLKAFCADDVNFFGVRKLISMQYFVYIKKNRMFLPVINSKNNVDPIFFINEFYKFSNRK